MNVANKAIANVMDIVDVARERRGIFSGHVAAYKSFSNEYDMWMVATYVCLEGSKLRVIPDSTGIPEDNVKLLSVIEVCL